MMRNNPYGGRTILLERDCDALLIPHGHAIDLQSGSAVRITQALGDNFTVEVQGNLLLIMGEDSDALGIAKSVDEKTHPILFDDSVDLEKQCWYQLKRCYDPEIPVNIVDLGLIYSCDIKSEPNTDTPQTVDNNVAVVMTLTSPACGMGPVLVEEVKRKLSFLSRVSTVAVEITFEPPWSQDSMSKAARLQLGLL